MGSLIHVAVWQQNSFNCVLLVGKVPYISNKCGKSTRERPTSPGGPSNTAWASVRPKRQLYFLVFSLFASEVGGGGVILPQFAISDVWQIFGTSFTFCSALNAKNEENPRYCTASSQVLKWCCFCKNTIFGLRLEWEFSACSSCVFVLNKSWLEICQWKKSMMMKWNIKV